MLEMKVTCPSQGIYHEMTICVPDHSAYNTADIQAFADRAIAVSAQATARSKAERAFRESMKRQGFTTPNGKSNPSTVEEARRLNVPQDAIDAAMQEAGEAVRKWAGNEAHNYRVERRDEEATAAKREAKTAKAVASMSDEAKAALLEKLAAEMGLKVGKPSAAKAK